MPPQQTHLFLLPSSFSLSPLFFSLLLKTLNRSPPPDPIFLTLSLAAALCPSFLLPPSSPTAVDAGNRRTSKPSIGQTSLLRSESGNSDSPLFPRFLLFPLHFLRFSLFSSFSFFPSFPFFPPFSLFFLLPNRVAESTQLNNRVDSARFLFGPWRPGPNSTSWAQFQPALGLAQFWSGPLQPLARLGPAHLRPGPISGPARFDPILGPIQFKPRSPVLGSVSSSAQV